MEEKRKENFSGKVFLESFAYYAAGILDFWRKLYKIKAACFSIALMFFALGGTALNYEYDIVNSIVYHNLSAEDLGFPTDEYGLIMVE